MFPGLSFEQRRAIQQHGTPLLVSDHPTETAYILLRTELLSTFDQSGFTARIPGIMAFGEGDTKEAACLALSEALRGYLDAFGNA
jgi:hypothetical protein